jgi:transcriptional regulator GlxA family with amidase domain
MARPLVRVLLFPDVELLDFAGPLEVFSVARDAMESPLFEVRTVAPVRGPLRTRHGLQVSADETLDDAAGTPREAIMVVPGGFGVRALLESAVPSMLRVRHAAGVTVASVCTGAWLLARAGLLESRQATTHHLCLGRLQELSPRCRLRPDLRVVDEGSVLTSGGISAGIDMALHLVGRHYGAEQAMATAKYMEYRWLPTDAGASGAAPN